MGVTDAWEASSVCQLGAAGLIACEPSQGRPSQVIQPSSVQVGATSVPVCGTARSQLLELELV